MRTALPELGWVRNSPWQMFATLLAINCKAVVIVIALHNVVTATCCCCYFVAAVVGTGGGAPAAAAEKCMSLPEAATTSCVGPFDPFWLPSSADKAN